jgi:hypothetical protein
MSGIFYGALVAVNPIYMRALMNIKKLITSLPAMKSQEKIDSVIIW